MLPFKSNSYAKISSITKAAFRQFSAAQDKTIKPSSSWSKPTPQDFSKLRIYQHKSKLDLLNLLVFNTVCTKDVFVDNCHHIYSVSNKLLGSTITNAAIKNTMGRIFISGDSLQAVEKFVKNWKHENVNLYLDYANEAIPGQAFTTEDFNDTTRVFCESIALASRAGDKSGIAIKVSALCPHEVLLKTNMGQVNIYSIFSKGYGNLDETLTAQQIWNKFQELKMDVSFSDLSEFFSLLLNRNLASESELNEVKVTKFEWMNNLHAYYISDVQKNANKVLSQLTKLTSSDLEELEHLNKRLDEIFKKARQEKV